jgi:iron complex outermembrane receptor protein
MALNNKGSPSVLQTTRAYCSLGLSVFLIGGALSPAGAQQQVSVANGAELEEVIVTGSRIAVPNATSTSPIQVVTAKEIKLGGKTDMIDLINQLPQNFQNSAADFSNTSSGLTTPGGISTADLRGLGPQRTLVLIDGRRLGTGDPNTANPNSAPDLDQIPVALVERVEVVTGGASATYGSDAIAGVVNFIMKKNFEGIELDGQLSEFWHQNHEGWVQGLEQAQAFDVVSGSRKDGQNRNFSLLLGTNIADGKGNITGYLSYLKAEPITSGARDFGGCQLNLNKSQDGVICGGSANSNFFGLPDGAAYTVVGNQLLPWPQAGSNPPGTFNSQRYIYASRGDERYNGGFLAHVDVSDSFKPYAELGFMNDKTNINIAPSGLFSTNPFDPTGNGNFNINCSNPLLSAQEAALMCTPAQIAADRAAPGSVSANIIIGRRNVEGGGREAFWDHTNYRAVTGVKGDFATAWSYDAYGSYYYTSLFNSNSNYLNFASVNNALQVTTGPNGPVCISGPPCVPWNIFQTGGVTPQQYNSLYTSGTSYGTSTERILHADITGDLGKYGLKSPLANEGVGVNFGAEHRNDHLSFAPDGAELSGELSGFGGASVAIDNGTSVTDDFVELRAPLIQDRAGAKDLVVDTGFRHSKYDLAGGVNTYKFEVQYAPTSDLRFRGGYQRAIRAPNIIELFTPQALGLIGSPGIDPCAPTRDTTTGVLTPASASLADCMRTGVTAAEYGNGSSTDIIKQCTALQCASLAGGNPQLKPERGDSVSVGVNLTPTFLRNFSASIDYWQIKLQDAVGVIPAAIILQKCLATGDPTYCNLIERDSRGSITGSSVQTRGYILQTSVNTSAAKVSGIDVQANYKLPLAERWGTLAFELAGSAMLTNATTSFPGAPSYDCAGLYGLTCQTVNPRWRHNLRISWATPWEVEFSALWRYIGATSLDTNSSDPSLANGKFDAFDARMPGISYLDLSASWNITRGVEVRAGINNAFDKDPPIVSANVSASGAANSFPTYDQLGRQLFIAFTAKY